MLIKITLLVAAAVLPLLFIAPRKSFLKKIALPLLLIALGIHIGAHFFNTNPFNLKFLALFKSLALLTGISIVFNVIRSNRIVQIALYIGLLLGLKYFYLPINEDGKKINVMLGIDDHFELLVELKEGSLPDVINEIVEEYQLQVEKAFYPASGEITELDDYYMVGIPDQNENFIESIKYELSLDPDVDWVEYNEEIQLAPITELKTVRKENSKIKLNDPLLDQQWGLQKTNVGEYYDWIEDADISPKRKARIAILDTGVDANHEDLKEQYSSIKKSHDNDPRGHGTLCAGVAAAVSNNQTGIASLVPGKEFVELSSIKVLNSMGMGTQQKILKGMIEAADQQVDVISMSLGGPSSDSKQRAYNSAVDYANQKGAIVIVAAGNSNKNAKSFSPANASGVIAVSALDEDMSRAPFSNTVEDLEMAVAAPGVNIHSTYPGNKYGSFSGTSFACPYVAGLVAVMRSIDPDLTTQEAFAILNESGHSVSAGSRTGNVIAPKNALSRLVAEKSQ